MGPDKAVSDTGAHPLSLAFMRGHPAQAARVLEALPADAAAQLFLQSPARLGAAVLTAMLPHRAALCVAALSDERVLELLAGMATQPTVALLRQLPEARRQRLIAGLPTAAAMASSLLLGYADDTLGAWADPDVVMLGASTRASDALARVREAPLAHPVVFVAGSERRLVGELGIGPLLQAPGAATLATLMRRPAALLRAHAPLAGTAAHPGWELSSLLPVVEPGDRLVGVLTRDALARALRRAVPAALGAAPGGLPALMAHGYWQALSGLMDAGLTLLPRAAPVLPQTQASADASAPATREDDGR
jgi:Mg/Co/Ni transporter MgtE